MNSLTFSGHQSFTCKHFWLKKGFDFLNDGFKFSDIDLAISHLGVGKNMVDAMRHYNRAFGVCDEFDYLSELGVSLFDDNGYDPYLEDIGSIWLLHYSMVKNGKASIYNLVFNQFRRQRFEFSKEQLEHFLIRTAEEAGESHSENTIRRDVQTFLKNYVKPKDGYKEIEDKFAGLLLDLELVKSFKAKNLEDELEDWYKIESQERPEIPYQIILYSILDNYEGENSISFKELQVGENSPGLIFALNIEGLLQKLGQITSNYKDINFTQTAGNQVLQFRNPIDKIEVIDDYYSQK